MIAQALARSEQDPKQELSQALACPGFYSEVLQIMRQPDSVDLLKTIKETTKRIAWQEAQIIKAQEMQIVLQQQKVKEIEMEKSL